MKLFAELTDLGRVRRMRQLARVALGAYGLAEAHFELVVDAGNTLFRVFGPDATETTNDLFAAGQYLLRIHLPIYQTADTIALEMAWLTAMRREADLPVPEPVPTLDGRLFTQVVISGVPEERCCSLLRWVKGRLIPHSAQAHHHYRAQGQLMGRMHHFAAYWQPPPDLTKRHYDWNGLFMNDAEVGLVPGESWGLLPQPYVKPFEIIAQRTQQLMDEWGTSSDVYGLIHADCGLDANVLFWKGEARPIDFDSSGFGYWMYDLAVALEHCRDGGAFPQYRDSLLAGYSEFHTLSAQQCAQLELFMAAFHVYWCLWAAAIVHLYPEGQGVLRERLERDAQIVVRYLSASNAV